MKRVVVIPARLNSSRLPYKVLLDLKGKTVLQRVFEQCLKVKNAEIYIATDSELIREKSLAFTKNVIMTKSTHESGTERVVEAVSSIDCNIVVNVQGDEPFINPILIENLFDSLENDDVLMSSVMERITEKKDLINPNSVKVITDDNEDALYFSYTKGVNSIRADTIKLITFRSFLSSINDL